MGFLNNILKMVRKWTSQTQDISMVDYLFGMKGVDFEGINHFLIEVKLFIFYSWKETDSEE